ncbi:cytochrome P450 [Rhodococcus sp. T2V]|uniref:cytochrome P450 n=1 Tax=Rhodococcus sp. T2V TaxID=3034164 RepID=UPI0023E29DE0|nr:cytochrome P450 [Rhodococcus sp. T2V]MDF3312930.1 cytochrome P450 [Rhodococcus sp. T2V]
MTVQSQIPVSDIDLFTDDALRDPYALYAALREMGPVVHLPQYDLYAITQYAGVREVTMNCEVFSSAQGVGLNDVFNTATRGNIINSDPPEHRVMRQVLQRPLAAEKLRDIEPLLQREAAAVVNRVLASGSFDVIEELAQHLPLTVVSKLVGLGDYGRERMLDWAAAAFDALGPMNERTAAALPKAKEMVDFALSAKPDTLDPDGWAAALFAAGEAGELPAEKCPVMVQDYTAPSLDTTILGIGSILWLFATHPDQWEKVRQNPALIRHAINEGLRLESPIQLFCRVATEDHRLGDVTITAGSRVMVLYGSANRDERKYQNADVFDVTRKASDHLAFGAGEHACIGMTLARLEIRLLLEQLVPRVKTFELGDGERMLNNLLRGFSHLEMRAILDDE